MLNVDDQRRDIPLLFLTQLEHAALTSPAGERLGQVQDLIARLDAGGLEIVDRAG